MTPAQKETVYNLRLQGLGYKAIARELLLSVDAVKELLVACKGIDGGLA